MSVKPLNFWYTGSLCGTFTYLPASFSGRLGVRRPSWLQKPASALRKSCSPTRSSPNVVPWAATDPVRLQPHVEGVPVAAGVHRAVQAHRVGGLGGRTGLRLDLVSRELPEAVGARVGVLTTASRQARLPSRPGRTPRPPGSPADSAPGSQQKHRWNCLSDRADHGNQTDIGGRRTEPGLGRSVPGAVRRRTGPVRAGPGAAERGRSGRASLRSASERAIRKRDTVRISFHALPPRLRAGVRRRRPRPWQRAPPDLRLPSLRHRRVRPGR
ncbi:hypothetical protein SCALM49S_00021 [Streptomyces californicus]